MEAYALHPDARAALEELKQKWAGGDAGSPEGHVEAVADASDMLNGDPREEEEEEEE